MKNSVRQFINPIYFIIFLLLGILFIFLHPKLITIAYPKQSENKLNNILSVIKQEKKITGQLYWEFREFYSPGYFVFDRSGLRLGQLDKELGMLRLDDNSLIPVLYYDSRRLKSADSLTSLSTLTGVKNNLPFSDYIVVHENDEEMIIKREGKFYIFLLFSNSELQKTNGFFNYNDADMELTKDKKWLSIAVIE